VLPGPAGPEPLRPDSARRFQSENGPGGYNGGGCPGAGG